jgi:hypothetical protein
MALPNYMNYSFRKLEKCFWVMGDTILFDPILFVNSSEEG